MTAVERETVIGVDVGGTRIKAALVASDGTVVAESTHPTPPDFASTLGATISGVTRALLEATPYAGAEATATAAPPVAVGVVVPGIVDEQRGVGVWSANLGWRDLDLRAALDAPMQSVLPDARVAIGHDVRAGLVAEHRLGAARGARDVLFVPIGTGIASATLCNGRLLVGSGWAGEIGHVVVTPGGPLCGCGKHGCLEAIASASAIGRRWRELTGSQRGAEEVAERVTAGDETARAIWADAVDALASVVAPVVAATAVDRVLIGGGLVQAGDTLLTPLRAAVSARFDGSRSSLEPDLATHGVEIVAASLGDRAGSLGAAVMAADLAGIELRDSRA